MSSTPPITPSVTSRLPGTQGGPESGQRVDTASPAWGGSFPADLAAPRHRAAADAVGGGFAPPSGSQPAVPFEGFDLARPQDPWKSAKDAFAHAVRNAPLPPGEDKQALEAWFNRYIRPQMEAFGHQIHWVRGDKMSFTSGSGQGTFTVDFLRGAGAPGWGVAWQVEGAGGGGGGGVPGGIPPMYLAFMQRLGELVAPDAERDEMEAAIRRAAEETGVRYAEVYKESIRLPGLGWVDLVRGYSGNAPAWQWLVK